MTVASDIVRSTTYTNPPPTYPSAKDRENSEVVVAGPTARTMETRSWAIPFVAPKDARLGDAAEM